MKRLALSAFLVIVVVVAVLLAVKWPFTRERITVSLERMTASRMRFERYEMTFFPHPGCVVSNVEILRDGAPSPLARIRRLTIDSSWTALFTFQHRVLQMRPEGMEIALPDPVPPAMHLHPPPEHDTVIREFDADGTTLHVRGKTFEFRKLKLRNLGRTEQIGFQADMSLPDPPANVIAEGLFGPWKGADTRLQGSYHLKGGNLSKYNALQGTLEGKGNFKGVLGRIVTDGDVSLAGFRVRQKGPETALKASYAAAVNGTNGETTLDRVDVQFLRSRLIVSGTVGKHIRLDFDGSQTRIQDLLQVAASADDPALSGPIDFSAHVELPPGDDPFLKRVQLNGRFRIDDARFRRRTQTKLNELSSRARGEDKDDAPERVASDLQGTVNVRNGLANFSSVSFKVPGARANGAGTFHLISKRVDFKGKVAMAASLSDASGGGWKSFLLKPIDIFFRDKKRRAGAVLPVTLKGTYPNAKAQVSIVP